MMEARRPYASYQPLSSRVIGIGLIVLLHAVLIYALIHALARRSIEVARTPIETKIITQAPPPVAAPPPPTPQFAPPAPPFVPPPEVHVATPPPPRSTAPTAITTVKPPAPTPPSPAPAPTPAPAAPVTVVPHLDSAHSREPDYPLQSRRLGEQGAVIMQVLVDPDGSVIDSKLVQSSGSARLDEAALAGVKTNYRFFPGTVDGKPQRMWLTIKFNWKLQ